MCLFAFQYLLEFSKRNYEKVKYFKFLVLCGMYGVFF